MRVSKAQTFEQANRGGMMPSSGTMRAKYSESAQASTGAKDADAERLKRAIWGRLNTRYIQCVGQMAAYSACWSRYDAMFDGRWRPPDGAPFRNVHLSKLAQGIRKKASGLFDLTIPNRSTMDFFRLIAADKNVPPDWGGRIEALIREDLIDGHFGTCYDAFLLDRVRIGNGMMWPTWCQRICCRVERRMHPAYSGEWDAAELLHRGLGVTQNGTVFEIDPPHRTVPKVIERTLPYVESSRPKMLYLNPYNVYPTELDKNNIAECAGFFVYDAVCVRDLRADTVSWIDDMDGGTASGIYPEDSLAEAEDMERMGVPAVNSPAWSYSYEMEDRLGTADYYSRLPLRSPFDAPTVQDITRFRRWTWAGAFNWMAECRLAGMEPDSPAAQRVLKDFGVRPDEAGVRQTWIVEGGVDGPVLLRCQPSPNMDDALPIVHSRHYWRNNSTLGYGEYEVGEGPERLYNWNLRMRMVATQRNARPMVEVIRSGLDQNWINAKGDIHWEPDGIIFKKQGGPDQGPIVRPVDYPKDAAAAAADGMAAMERELYDQTGISRNAVGSSNSGGITAREAGLIQSNYGDIEKAHATRLGEDTLGPVIFKLTDLHRLYEETPRDARVPDKTGTLGDPVTVPAEAWGPKWLVNVTGPGTVANQSVLLAGMDRITSAAETLLPLSGKIPNGIEILKDIARGIGLPDVERYIGADAPEDQNPMRTAISAALTGNDITPTTLFLMLEKMFKEPLSMSKKVGIIRDSYIKAGTPPPTIPELVDILNQLAMLDQQANQQKQIAGPGSSPTGDPGGGGPGPMPGGVGNSVARTITPGMPQLA